MEQFHHYIPRFILRNFATNDFIKRKNTKVGICGGPDNIIQLDSRKAKKKPNKNPYINVMSSDGVLKKEKISTTYGVTNMYKDPNAADAMEVEKLLATLESEVSVIFKRISNDAAQQQDTTLTRHEMRLVKKFLFVMSYRKDRRRNQYINNTFDFATGMLMRKFMEANKFESPERVWLNNIRTILEVSDLDQLLIDGSKPLFPSIRMDLEIFIRYFFTCLWKAPPGTEFLISNCAFGLWEGSGPSLVFHHFYPVTPSLMWVQSSVKYKSDEIGQTMSLMFRQMGARRSWFENVLHPIPKTFYKKTGSDKLRIGPGDRDPHDPLDEYTYSFVEIPKEAINRINAITIDESVQISFTSELCFYKSLKYYSRVETENRIDVKPMAQALLRKLREGQ